MTETEILTEVLQREGGFRQAVKRPNGTWDPATHRGITAVTLGIWRKLGRHASVDELKKMPEHEARAIYRMQFVEGPGFLPELVPHEGLRAQLIDFGINSSPGRAVRYLQRVIGVPVTGQLDAVTVTWLFAHVGELRLVNDALAGARARMVVGAVEDGAIRSADELGLLRRSVGFVESRP